MTIPVTIKAGGSDTWVQLPGDLTMPQDRAGIVVFAHGSGSSRLSSRNRAVAENLQHRGFATLLFDLLTEDEDVADAQVRERRFDIELLSQRLVDAVDHTRSWDVARDLPVGLFGASTGAAAALVTATWRPTEVSAVVSRGGRPDLADDALSAVAAPSLLIVGGHDESVLAHNREAAAKLTAAHELRIIPGATHLFTERGALDQVAELAADWFERYVQPHTDTASRAPGS